MRIRCRYKEGETIKKYKYSVPRQTGCEFYKTFQGAIQSQHRNIRVNLGDIYCDHKKKAKKFKRGEKRFAPDWCPKRHKVPIIKVYELTEMGLLFALKQGLNEPKVINRCEYELRYTGKIQKVFLEVNYGWSE